MTEFQIKCNRHACICSYVYVASHRWLKIFKGKFSYDELESIRQYNTCKILPCKRSKYFFLIIVSQTVI